MRTPHPHRLATLTALSALVLTALVGVAHAGNFVEENGSDFDCDGLRDLVRGNPEDTVGGVIEAGSVTVTYSGTGTTHKITQDTPGVPGAAEPYDIFGSAHTSYDRDLDGCDDLVVGTPHEDLGSIVTAGMVIVIPGSPTGLDTSRAVAFTQDSPGFPGKAEARDGFGYHLVGGVTDDGKPFLLVTSAYENDEAGAVHYVRSDVISMIMQDSPGVAGTSELNDAFGSALAASGRYFVIGSRGEAIGGEAGAGMIHVFRHPLNSGAPTPVAGIHQDTPGVSGSIDGGDAFGFSVSVVSYQRSDTDPVGALVAVGSPWEGIGAAESAGMAHLLYVSDTGETSQVAAVSQATAGVTGTPEYYDLFGTDVVLANLNPAVVAIPQATVWAVSVSRENLGQPEYSAVHVFPQMWQPGQPDVWLVDGTNGLPRDSLGGMEWLRASASHLHVGDLGASCHAIPWQNLLTTADDIPATLRDEDCTGQ